MHADFAKKNVIQKLETGSESNLVSAIFNNMEIKIRKSLEILTKFNIKTLLYSTLLYVVFRLKNP